MLAEFIKQFYAEAANIPAQVLLPHEIEEANIIQQWLKDRRGGPKVELVVPRQGVSQELVEMAAENASKPCARFEPSGKRIRIARAKL